MVKKLQKLSADKKSGSQLRATVKDSAQQIWLAGLGAFAKAQEEGGKVFDALVKEGVGMQRKTQGAAEEKLSETTSKMASMANDIGSKAQGGWDKLETIFEDRVAKALKKLGVPSSRDISELIDRMDALNKSVEKLGSKPASARPASAKPSVKAATKAAAAPAKKAAAKRAPRKAAA